MWPIFALICPWKRSHGFAWVCCGALSLGRGAAAQVLAVSSMHWIAFLGKTGQFRCAAAQRNYLDSVFCGASSPFLLGWFMLTDDLENFCFGQG